MTDVQCDAREIIFAIVYRYRQKYENARLMSESSTLPT